MKKILFYLHHPAHFHLFRHVIYQLKRDGKEVIILATKKDILEELLLKEGFNYINVLPNGRKDNKASIAFGLIKQDLKLLKICLKHKPDILVGTSTEITHIGRLLNIPSLFVNEDDAAVIPLVRDLAYRFAKIIISPEVCNNGKYEYKAIKYQSYHELAYLHPNVFIPKREIVEKYFNPDKPYAIIRFSKLGAHHDIGVQGISNVTAWELINVLSGKFKVYITSERPLETEFEPYRMSINPLDIHHVINYATVFIGDSQTMAAEAGVLGTPFFRCNDFVGRISYLRELEEVYNLGFGFNPSDSNIMIDKLKEIIKIPDLKQQWQIRRRKMLSEKVDLSAFLIWFIENYPESEFEMKNNPAYQYNFK